MNIRAFAAIFALAVALTGCSAGSDAILQTLPYAYGRNPGVDDARLNPSFRYLRVTIGGRVALLALGNLDGDARDPIEVWYSAQREVLRLRNGRLIGAVGLTSEWRNVVLPELPSWSAVARSDREFHWTRIRDVMPGYRFGVRDELSLRQIEAPPLSQLRGIDPHHLRWFEERMAPPSMRARAGVLGGSSEAGEMLPPARYAVEIEGTRATVLYGEQCISPKLCFAWQRWPVERQREVRQGQ